MAEFPAPVNPVRTEKFWRDWAERVFWTALEVIVAVFIVEVGPLVEGEMPQWAIPLWATGLAALKGFVARQVSNKDSASTAPGV